ncbi:hypothetical protein [Mycoplasmopsis iners]|uniref:hypothetical protein n=1 Tax=Mycoplasmopsis iners TaxID=76630 RepID=UPI00068EEE0F|nr:hypothetical protein [Mycoplasmopsis iners]
MAKSNFWNKLKGFFLNKTFLYSAVGVAVVGVLAASLTYKYSHKFKPSFYNYKQYINDGDDVSHKRRINQDFDFKEFDTLNQFTNAILTNKAVAGIGSDSQAVTLIKKGKLEKLDFKKLFPKAFESNPDASLEEVLKSIYTEGVWNHLASYDDELLTDENGKAYEQPLHLWEYFLPYFAQDMVVAYNPAKLNLKNQKHGAEYDFKATSTLEKKIYDKLMEERPEDKSWEAGSFSLYSILKVLKEEGFDNLEATDAVRDNMIYGSAYRLDKNANKYVSIYATGKGQNFNKVNDPNKLIELFKKHVEDEKAKGNNFETSDKMIEELEMFANQQTSGASNYQELIDQFESLIKNATGYALNSSKINFIGNGLELVDKIISPQSEIQMGIIYNGDTVDAFFGNDNNSNVRDGELRYLRPKDNLLLVDGLVIVKGTSDEVKNKVYSAARDTFIQGIGDGTWDSVEDKLELGSVLNFDSVGYTPVFKKVVEYVREEYFKSIEEWEKPDNFTDEEWAKHIEYEIKYVNNLFDIKDHYTVWNPLNPDEEITAYNVHHYDIKPVDQKTLTEIETYWNLKIKK